MSRTESWSAIARTDHPPIVNRKCHESLERILGHSARIVHRTDIGREQIYEASGRIFYQAAPCPANTHGGDMSLNVNRPFTGQAQPPATINSSPITTDTATATPDHSAQEDGERSPPKQGTVASAIPHSEITASSSRNTCGRTSTIPKRLGRYSAININGT